MIRISMEEFNDRALALQRARKIFIESGLTNNITKAFEAYQTILAETERKLFLTNLDADRRLTVMDNYERPKCPECGSDFLFRPIQQNDRGILSQLVCSNKSCDVVLNDTHDIPWWMEHLSRRK